MTRTALLLTVLLPLVLASRLGAEADPIVPSPELVTVTPNRPGSIRVGQQIVLRASGSAEVLHWHLVGGGSDTYYTDSSGKAVVFASDTPGRFVFVVSGTKRSEGVPPLSVKEHVVTVEGTAPQPPKPVVPVTPDVPVPTPLPAGRFGLAEFTRKACDKLTATQKTLCPQISADWSSVSTQIAAQTIKTFADANTTLKKKLRATTKEPEGAPGPWAILFTEVNLRLNELAKAKTLNVQNLQDVQDAFREVSVGFAAVQ